MPLQLPPVPAMLKTAFKQELRDGYLQLIKYRQHGRKNITDP